MEVVIIALFVLGYLAIALEQPLKINKTATALLTGVLCWTIYSLSSPQPVAEDLSKHLASITEILFFILGAMTIVEIVDSYQGFRHITDRITSKDPVNLLWIVCWTTFFLSAILDNLTTSIVMVSLIRKLIPDKKIRIFYAGMVVIAANAGGAWTPIGDITTTMLWIGGQISTLNIMMSLFIPSVICLLVPLSYLTFKMRKETVPIEQPHSEDFVPHLKGSGTMLLMGVGALIFVPIFKTITHLPPYTGMLLGLGAVWIVSEIKNPHADEELGRKYTAAGALSRIDTSSVLFFLGILLAISALESMHLLSRFATWIDSEIGYHSVIITLTGLVSAIIDNVPLVAASMGMYSLELFPRDHVLWEYLAYCAGTGGSILIIGSAAGVAVMGMEKIDFVWYLKKLSPLALLGYLSGCLAYLLMNGLI